MSDENEKVEETTPSEQPKRSGRRKFASYSLGIIGGTIGLFVLVGLVLYNTGYVASYVESSIKDSLSQMNIDLTTSRFDIGASPLTVDIENAEFKDKLTGERLAFIKNARLEMTILELLSLSTTRDIRIDTTAIDGAEVWVKFDENGRSNFSNIKLIEDERGSSVNFLYESTRFSLTNSVVHFNDISRSIGANANALAINFSPNDSEGRRFRFDLASSGSDFTYGDGRVENISVAANGIADDTGADVENLTVKTPIGNAEISGRVDDWASPRYDLAIRSDVDLTQTAAAFNIATPLTGSGNFVGKITGQGEQYRVEGEVVSRSMRAGDVYLRGANINATIAGTNRNYEANGTAVAEMLTFDDFRIDFLKAFGNVRGNGTDFNWVGDLQAAAIAAGKLSIAELFLSDARAEINDRAITAAVGNGRVKRFAIGDTEFADLRARNLRLDRRGDVMTITAPDATTRQFKTKTFSVNDVTGRGVKVVDRPRTVDVDVDSLNAKSGKLGDADIYDITTRDFRFRDLPSTTELQAKVFRAGRIVDGSTVVEGLEAPEVSIVDTPRETVIYSDRVRVAKINADGARFGSLNVAGVRLNIRDGRVEARSDDIVAGDVVLDRSSNLPDGGRIADVNIRRPVYVLERSGRYRASADMSIGGGVIGSIDLGEARSSVVIENGRVTLDGIEARIMDGNLTGRAVIGLDRRTGSNITGDFIDLDVARLLSIAGGRVIPIDGKTSGRIDLAFPGTDLRSSTGRVDAAIAANAGNADDSRIPITGEVRLAADNGLFSIDKAELTTPESKLSADGRFDLKQQNSELRVRLDSRNANEVDRLFRLTGVAPDVERQLDSLRAEFAGRMTFDGTITGNLLDPDVKGRAEIASFSLRDREIGSVSTDISVDPFALEFTNGKLTESGGGSADFAVRIPFAGTNNTSVNGELRSIELSRILSVVPIDLPERIRDLSGKATGSINITGLPDNAQGSIDLAARDGSIAGQTFDSLTAKATFAGSLVNIEQAEMLVGTGSLSANGTYDRVSEAFDLALAAKAFPLPILLAAMPPNDSIPQINGIADLTAKATGIATRSETFNVNFDGLVKNVDVGGQLLGEVKLNGNTSDGILIADVIADIEGQKQVIIGTVNLQEQAMPVNVSTNFDRSPIAPFLAFVPQLKDLGISGSATGRVTFAGRLRKQDAEGNYIFSTDDLAGDAEFSQLALQIQDTPLNAIETVKIRFSAREINFDNAKFSGGGSNMIIAGTKALAADAVNDLSINGRVNLRLLNLTTKDTFFGGYAETSVRLSGSNADARLFGTANILNGSVATFLGSDRYTIDRVRGRLIFTSDQIELQDATGFLGGGRFTASGGGYLDGLKVQSFRVALDGNNVTVPLPKDFVTTGDARLEVTGIRQTAASDLQLTIAGRVQARRSLYSKDIDLANIVGARRDATLAGSGGSMTPPRFDIVIEGRDALVVKNNLADLTASVSLILTGDTDAPRLSGRITANSGTIFFRNDRYVVQRGVLEFPPDTAIEPVINLQAETDIAGYQIYVNFSGPLTDSELLAANVRSSPALPQADIISLITTGSLTNSSGGIPTLAQTGINTAAEILTDSIINNPARRATDKLFGLNVFEVDPLIAGRQSNPSARLTVGRQINTNLRVTYSTNLSQDQNQVLAFEYRVSNRLSFVAQYEQRSLSNVTRDRDNFSFEVRFRKRF